MNRQGCSQATFNSVSETLGFKNELLFKCVHALEGGGAGTSECSCGAFSGSLVAVSYFFGRSYKLWDERKIDMKAILIGQKIYRRFIDKYNSAICKEIQIKKFGRSFNFMDENDLKIFEEMGGHERICPTVVGLASTWVIEILWKEITKDKDISKIVSREEAIRNF